MHNQLRLTELYKMFLLSKIENKFSTELLFIIMAFAKSSGVNIIGYHEISIIFFLFYRNIFSLAKD